MWKDTLGCVLAAGMLTVGSSAVAAVDPVIHGPTAKVKQLYVIESGQGKLIHDADNHYHLVVPIRDIKNILVFTERPVRKSFRMEPDKFAAQVHTGSHSFDMDNPNVIIAWDKASHPAEAYRINSSSKKSGFISYDLTALSTKEKSSTTAKEVNGALSLFIDDSADSDHVATYTTKNYTSFSDCESRNSASPFFSFFMCWGWSSETYTEVSINGSVVN